MTDSAQSFTFRTLAGTQTINVLSHESQEQAVARHFQVDLDDLFMTLQKESVLSNVSNAVDLVSRLDFNEYHRRRNGFDTRKYC